MSRRAVAYIRVSTPGQVIRGFSISEQEAATRAYIEARGYTLTESVYDAGESGQLEHRPGLQRIRQLAHGRQCDLVVASKLDRLGRDALIILNALDYLRRRGVPVEYTDLQIDVSTPIGRYIEVSMAGFAGLELELIRERMMRGRVGKAKQGRMPIKYRGLGFRSITVAEAQLQPEHHGRDGEIVWVESEVPLVREIYTRAASGNYTRRSLAIWLNAQGYRTLRGNLWTGETVGELLANPVYRGEVRYGVRRLRMQEDPDTGRKRRVPLPRDPEAEQVWEIPPLIAPDLWWQAQRIIQRVSTVRTGRPPGAESPLHGIVYCGRCTNLRNGEPLRAAHRRHQHHPGKVYRYYQCSSAQQIGRESCGGSASAPELEARAYSYALAALRPGRLGALARTHAERRQGQAAHAQTEADRLRAALQEVKASQTRLARLVVLGFDTDVVETQARELQVRRTTLEEQLRTAEALLQAPLHPDQAEADAESLAERWRSALAAAQDQPLALRPVYEQCLRIYLDGKEPPRFTLLLPFLP